jgi:hypothetical protein
MQPFAANMRNQTEKLYDQGQRPAVHLLLPEASGLLFEDGQTQYQPGS